MVDAAPRVAQPGGAFTGRRLQWRMKIVVRPVHAGDVLYLLTSLGWHVVRYESNVPQKRALLYLSLPGVRDEVVVPVPREALFAWPEELK
jgi:hypothetical protein